VGFSGEAEVAMVEPWKWDWRRRKKLLRVVMRNRGRRGKWAHYKSEWAKKKLTKTVQKDLEIHSSSGYNFTRRSTRK
jgi:hypothetical protein